MKSTNIRFSRKRKPKAVAIKKTVLNRKLQNEFIRFLEYSPVSRVSRNLRRTVLEYLMHDGVVGSVYLYETLSDVHRLFELLDAAEEEWKAA